MSLKRYYGDFSFGEAEPVVMRLAEALASSSAELVPSAQPMQREISPANASVLGSYASFNIGDHVQFFSCDLEIGELFETRGELPRGIWVGALFSGGWATRFGDKELEFKGDGTPRLLSFGEPTQYRDRPAQQQRIRMASYLVGEGFLEQAGTGDPDEPISALAGLLQPGMHSHPLSDPKPISDTLFRLLNNPYCGQTARLFVESTVLSSIFQLAQIVALGRGDPQPGPAPRSTLVAEARHQIDSALSKFESIQLLASSLGSNETTLQRQFKSETGMTVFQYVLERRMQAARLLVRDGHLQIAEISYRIGYSTPANFSTAYKRYYGVSPAEDRA